jgi:aspartyl-tRNA(Asn)/glutamyl-tRNA(Gln) amidotransferase subunit A
MAPMMSGLELADEVRCRRRTALSVVEEYLSHLDTQDQQIKSVTRVLRRRALTHAARIDATIASGADPGPLAGVPFGVKDLFDVKGEVTTAGAAIRRDTPAAASDATVVAKLHAAGAILIATLNMDEFAYGFATQNHHYGTTRNPHNLQHLAGGSSGGSAAAVAGGLLPITLGSDTNGSIRVPAALCGVWGLRPTYGRLSTEGTFPLAHSLDTVGPFAATLADLRATFEVLAGVAVPDVPINNLRVGRLDGWFRADADARILDGIDAIAAALGGAPLVSLPQTAQARSAAYLITAAEGGCLHLPSLRRRALDFDPATRDRLIAGALLPAAALLQARRFGSSFQAQVREMLERFDLLLAPTCPGPVPRIDAALVNVGGKTASARVNLGIYTQPVSLAGVPVLAAPLATLPATAADSLPLGIQIMAAPGREALLFSVARHLEKLKLLRAALATNSTHRSP